MKTAAIYARVSSDKQKEENTIASQTAALIAFAAEQGYAVPAEWVFEDEGYSGTLLHGSAVVAGQGSIGEGWNPVNNRKPRGAVQTPRQTPSSYRETALSGHEWAGI